MGRRHQDKFYSSGPPPPAVLLTMSESAPAAASDPRLHASRSESARSTSGPGSHTRPGDRRAALAGIAAHRHAGHGLASRAARSVADGAEEEHPLVVMRACSFVDLERRFLALTAYTHQSTRGRLTTERWPWHSCRRGSHSRGRSAQTGRRCARSATSTRLLWRRPSLAAAGNTGGCIDRVPFAALIHGQRRVILRHRIFVFLAEKAALYQDVETRRVARAAHFSHVEVDAPGNLFTAENEFRFLLALRLRFPDRHRDRHEHHHYRKTHQQRRHGVPALIGLTTR